ncbi:MAG: transketolase [Candidatus Caenarcaniphilales bacterium]|nr:transketolase [Candidatus Caenarcaniphilales bacterium]
MTKSVKSNVNYIRSLIVSSIYHAGSGHPGGCLSCVDIVDYLYRYHMSYSFLDCDNVSRDRFIMSKGHCVPTIYAVFCDMEYISLSELKTLRKINSRLQGHSHRVAFPQVEVSTGSLAQGFSFAIGESLGLKLQGYSNNVYAMIGDGELQEGQIWEGAMFAAHHNLGNLCTIVDYNKMQSDDLNENIIKLEPLQNKWESFGWNVFNIDGHNPNQIREVFSAAMSKENQKPSVVIAHTIKGKGVSYMESIPSWHGSVKLTEEDCRKALKDLECTDNEIEVLMSA